MGCLSGEGFSFRDYDPSAPRSDPPHCSYTEQWVQFFPILNQRSVEQRPVWIYYCSAWRNIIISMPTMVKANCYYKVYVLEITA